MVVTTIPDSETVGDAADNGDDDDDDGDDVGVWRQTTEGDGIAGSDERPTNHSSRSSSVLFKSSTVSNNSA